MNDSGFLNFETMVDSLLRLDNDETNQGEMHESQGFGEEVPKENSDKKLTSSGQIELEQLLESRTCKVCYKEDSCVVFVPCGHLACCHECGTKVKRCPVCRSFVKERIRSYLS